MKLAIPLNKKINRSWQVDVLLFLALAGFGSFMAIPLIYVINNAFKPLDELFIFPPTLFVRNATLENFANLFQVM